MENFTNDDILLRYPAILRPNIQELWTNSQIGISGMYIQINLPPNKLEFDYDMRIGNTFIINIPYAGKNLQWEVLFNDEDPTSAPDFDIINDSFLADPPTDTISKYLPTLVDWDITDPKCLTNVIKEMLNLYKTYQLEKISETKFIIMLEEYKHIMEELPLTDEDIELYVDSNALQILLSLRLDFSNLPAYIQRSYFGEHSILLNPGANSALLKISFSTNRVNSHLQLSPGLEQVFSDYAPLHIPSYKKNDDLVGYIRLIHQLIEEKINQIRKHFRLKEEYFSILLSLNGLQVLEYDNVTFNQGFFLFEIDNFYFLVQISIGNKFPQEKPSVVMQSVYHKSSTGEPHSFKVNNYPYNSQWTPQEMVKKMLKQVQDVTPKFRNYIQNVK